MASLARPIPNIRPITDLRTRLNEVCRQATDTQEPVVLTKNGTSAYVLVDCDVYNQQARSNRLAMALREAEIEEKYHPNAVPKEQADKRMTQIFESMGLSYA